MIGRDRIFADIKKQLERFRIVALLGPRQCGKTTLARAIAREVGATYFDLERADVRQRLANPRIELEGLKGLVVLDEVQSMPEVFSTLRGLADRDPLPSRFLILGSASPELIRGSSQSLAGRVGFVPMGPFGADEVGENRWRELWIRGGYPLSFLAGSEDDSFAWREAFIETFVERDLRSFGFDLPPLQVRRFWTMTAHYHGQVWNGSRVAASMGISQQTSRRYLDILAQSFMLRQLPPWFENAGKRVVKSPKVYIRDTGLLHSLLGLRDYEAVASHPQLGASFEGYCIEQIVRRVGERNAWFWATYGGAELDLLLTLGKRKIGVEFKWSDTPSVTKSMRIAQDNLQLDELIVIHPGSDAYPLDEKIRALPVDGVAGWLDGIG